MTKRPTAIQEVRKLKAKVTCLKTRLGVALEDIAHLRTQVNATVRISLRLQSSQRRMLQSLLKLDSSGPGLSVADAAGRAGISPNRLYGMIRRTGIREGLTIDGLIRIPEEAIPHISAGDTWPWDKQPKEDTE